MARLRTEACSQSLRGRWMCGTHRWQACSQEHLLTAQLDVPLDSGHVGVAFPKCPPHDAAGPALWEAFGDEVSMSAPATDHSTSSSPGVETGRPNLTLHAAGLSPVSPCPDTALGDKSPLGKDCVRRPQLADDHERNSGSPTGEPLSTIGQEDTSTAAFDISAKATPMKLQHVIDTTSATTGNEATIPESHVSVIASAYPRCIIAAQLTPRAESITLCNSKSLYGPPENPESAFDANASQANPSSTTRPHSEGSEEREASTTSSIEAVQSGYGGQTLCDSDDEDESMPRKPPSRHTMRVRSSANTQRVAETNRSQAALEMDCDEQEDNWPGVLQEGKIARQRKRSGEHHRASLDRDCHAGNAWWHGQKKSDTFRGEANDFRLRLVGRRGRPRKSNSQTTGRYKAKRQPASSHQPLPRQPMWEVEDVVDEPSRTYRSHSQIISKQANLGGRSNRGQYSREWQAVLQG